MPNLRFTFIVVLLFWSRQSHTDSRYPETLLYRALSRNHSTPTDLILEIQKWILRPSAMNMNQLIECRNSTQTIWRHRCTERMQWLLSIARKSPGTSFAFTPSTHVFALELLENGKRRSGCHFAMGWSKWTSGNHIQITFDIAARTRDGRFYAETRSIFFTGSRVYFSVSNQSVSLFGYMWGPAANEGFVIDQVTISWYPVGYTVTDIAIHRGSYRC